VTIRNPLLDPSAFGGFGIINTGAANGDVLGRIKPAALSVSRYSFNVPKGELVFL